MKTGNPVAAREARLLVWICRAIIAITAIIPILLFARCSGNPEAARQSVEDDTAILAAQGSVRALLRDPSSAEFTLVRKMPSAVCGMVNSRNAFGGMTGPHRFYAGAVTQIEPIEPDELFEMAWSRQC